MTRSSNVSPKANSSASAPTPGPSGRSSRSKSPLTAAKVSVVRFLRAGWSMLGMNRGSRRSTSSTNGVLDDVAAASLRAIDGNGVATYRPEYALRAVALRESCDGWPAGTVGVIIEPFEDLALVEISGEYG